MEPNKYNVHGIRVELSTKMNDEAEAAANMRQEDNERRGRRNNLAPGATQAQQLQAHMVGARTERIGKFWFDPCKWNSFQPNGGRELPDLELPCGIKIDIKWIGSDTHHLIVPEDNLKLDWYYVLISGEHHPIYWIMGWMKGDDIKKCGKEFDRPAYVCRYIQEIYKLNKIIEEASNGRRIPF